MRLIDEYGADDQRSMAANNSSAFNYRITTGSTKLSAHARGLAVDINPLYNPCRRTVGGKVVVEPREGRKYLQREAKFPYKIVKGDLCYRLFTARGFVWGVVFSCKGCIGCFPSSAGIPPPPDEAEKIRSLIDKDCGFLIFSCFLP